MSKRVLAYLIVDNSMLEEAKRRIEEEYAIVDIHASQYEELANNPMIGVPLANFGFKYGRYSTIIIERDLTDSEVDRLLDDTLAMLD